MWAVVLRNSAGDWGRLGPLATNIGRWCALNGSSIIAPDAAQKFPHAR
jgi:hypothetical protein